MRWLPFFFNVLIILSLVPFARSIEKAAGEVFSLRIGFYLLLFGCGTAFVFIGVVLLRKYRFHFWKFFWSVLLAGCFLWKMWSVREIPLELMHLIFYTSLFFTSFYALYKYIKDPLIYLVSIFLCLSVSFLDELFQWWVPRRFGELQDVFLNIWSIGFGLLFLLLVVRLRELKFRNISPTTYHFLAISFLITTALSCLFTQLTTQNVYRLSNHFECLVERYRVNGSYRNGTAEYGYLHKMDANISFKSREKNIHAFTAFDDEIAHNFKSNREDVMKKIREEKKAERKMTLSDFFPDFSAKRWENPLAYETAIRLFSRRRNIEKFQEAMNASDKRIFATRAYFENKILENTVPNMIALFDIAIEEEVIADLKKRADLNNPYLSRVSRNIITGITQKNLLWVHFTLFFSAIIFYFYAIKYGCARSKNT